MIPKLKIRQQNQSPLVDAWFSNGIGVKLLFLVGGTPGCRTPINVDLTTKKYCWIIKEYNSLIHILYLLMGILCSNYTLLYDNRKSNRASRKMMIRCDNFDVTIVKSQPLRNVENHITHSSVRSALFSKTNKFVRLKFR